MNRLKFKKIWFIKTSTVDFILHIVILLVAVTLKMAIRKTNKINALSVKLDINKPIRDYASSVNRKFVVNGKSQNNNLNNRFITTSVR